MNSVRAEDGLGHCAPSARAQACGCAHRHTRSYTPYLYKSDHKEECLQHGAMIVMIVSALQGSSELREEGVNRACHSAWDTLEKYLLCSVRWGRGQN